MLTDLGPAEDFVDGKFRLLQVRGKEVGVLRRGDSVYVVRNICPHAIGPVCLGYVTRPLTMSEGELRFDDDAGPVVVCPWHRWEYRLSDGRSMRDARFRLQMWPSRVENGHIVAEMPEWARGRQELESEVR
jgi:3-phenylpropionate/trans-cinnamate dioxygenase ferredoxin subunit